MGSQRCRRTFRLRRLRTDQEGNVPRRHYGVGFAQYEGDGTL